MRRSTWAVIIIVFSGMLLPLLGNAGTEVQSENTIILDVPYVCQKERLD
jgi:hypothetical protein